MKLFNFSSKEKPKMAKNTFYTGNTRPGQLAIAKDQDFSRPYINTHGGSEYVIFGEDNLYPYVLLELFHSSAFHRAIMEFKTRTIMADGLKITSSDTSTKGKMEAEKVRSILNKAFFRRFVQEYLIHERVYIKVNRKDSTYYNNIVIVPAETIRSTNLFREHNEGFIQADWKRGSRDRQYIKPFDKYNKKDNIQLIQYQELTPGFDIYAVPGYTSAADWIWLDSQFAYFQKQNMQNSLNPSAIIKIYEKFANSQQEKEYIENLQESFIGAQNAGKVMTFVASGKELAPDITMAEPNKLDKSFASAQENIVKNVSRAHLINPALMGIESAGKLGTTNELNEAFTLFNEVWLDSNQDVIQENLQDLIQKMGYANLDVKILRKDLFLESISAEN